MSQKRISKTKSVKKKTKKTPTIITTKWLKTVNELIEKYGFWDVSNTLRKGDPISRNDLPKTEYVGFRTDSTEMPLYDGYLEDPRYAEIMKDAKWKIVEMTPEQYMRKVYLNFKEHAGNSVINSHVTWESATTVDLDLCKKFAKLMKSGTKFPMPIIDERSGDQEGRHRAKSAELASIDKIPVMVISKYDFTDDLWSKREVRNFYRNYKKDL